MLHKKYIILFFILLVNSFSVFPNNEYLDFWSESRYLFGASENSNSHIISKGDLKNSSLFNRDHSDKKVGDFSIVFSPDSKTLNCLGFAFNLLHTPVSLSKSDALEFWLKTAPKKADENWSIRLVDNDNCESSLVLNSMDTDDKWQLKRIDFKDFKSKGKFNWNKIVCCEFVSDFSKVEKINIDDICILKNGSKLHITDKTLEQRKAEAKSSKNARINSAMFKASLNGYGTLTNAFAQLYLNKNIKQANSSLLVALENSVKAADPWSLETTPALCRIYYMFSSRHGRYKKRLLPEVEKRLLEVLWDRTSIKNDIYLALQGNTWWMDGSENHDLNAKMCNLVSSRIFMDEPEYKDRIYPDYGFGGGYEYGHSGYYGIANPSKERMLGGRANFSTGKRYMAKDHYEAWLTYMKNYIKERSKRGIMLEYGSPTYSKHSMNFFELGYSYSGDENLKSLIGKFITLYWADWSQVEIDGVRGGAKTRNHSKLGGYGNGGELVSFYMGGPGSSDVWGYWNMFNDYELPDIIWDMALNREKMGKFVYQSKGIGEEENIFPRPLGAERGMLCNTDSRFVRYAYSTPYYVIGTQMDHPAAIHSHLSCAGRWHGMTFADSENSHIVVFGENESNNSNKKYFEIMLQTVQNENVLMMQQFRQYFSDQPDWYPRKPTEQVDLDIWFGKGWDQMVEKDGWIFVKKGNAYCAVKIVLWDEKYEEENRKINSGTQTHFTGPSDKPTVKLKDKAYRWDNSGNYILLDDKYSGIIMESADKDEYETLDSFIADIVDNQIYLYKTVVPGYHIMSYKGCRKNSKEIVLNLASPQIPTIGGNYVNYLPDYTFNSPYIYSKYRSGIIKLKFNGRELELNFNA